MEIDEAISKMYARIIALLALAGGTHCRDHPEHLPFIMGTIARTIEAALQHNISSHCAWLDLCENYEQPFQIDLATITPHVESNDPFRGGRGGSGGWFGAGGGGGGFGLLNGGEGGPGADGAVFIFQIAEDNSPVDVDVFVTPGTSEAAIRPDAHTLEIVCVGGGGGGAAGGRWIDLARSPRLNATITSQSGLSTRSE
ncbi:hypothetical protein [Mycobacterium sp. E3305]|uniref:hypothetical protein n=1 Tax=Mycobacterium sp. E3305 TaxID=1834145 RepID=UPI0012E90655|nr:hypothetical protein [Mycobacterium sp. E3305]